MKFALIGPSTLTELDGNEIEQYLETVLSKGHDVFLLTHYSIEVPVIKYFILHSEHAPRLHLYSFAELEYLPKHMKSPIEYLVSSGAQFHSFKHTGFEVKRSHYVKAWEEIVQSCDIVISFYPQNGVYESIPKLSIPLDIAKSKGKRALAYTLPGDDMSHFHLTPDKKTRVI